MHLEHIKLCPDVWKYVMYFYGNLSQLIEWVYVTAVAEWQTGLLMPSLDSYSQFGSLPVLTSKEEYCTRSCDPLRASNSSHLQVH